MNLKTTKEVAEHLRLPEKATKKLMKRLGVEPFPLGVGRGLGDRWDIHEVEDAVRSLRAPKEKEKPRKPKPVSRGYFDGPCPPRLTKPKSVQ